MVTEPATRSPFIPGTVDAGRRQRRPRTDAFVVLSWLAVTVAVLGVSTVVVVASGMRPGYDAFGWLVWGHQVLHWNLNTDGAPSWKPLTFLFTLPYALAGSGQVWLWMVTAVAFALAGCVFAARVAYKLTGPSPQRPYAPWVAGVLAGVGVLGLDTYAHEILIANSDPMMVALCLAAIDFHVDKRPRLAFAMLVLASLGRPEAWAFTLVYAVWLWRTVPSMRAATLGGIALIPLLWFSIPALTSKDWFISGDLALRSVNPVNVIHGSKVLGVISRFRGLTVLPLQIAALAGIAIAAARRDRVTLTLAAAGCLWIALELGLALHGWSAASRYLFEPAALMVVIAGSAVGQILAFVPRGRSSLAAGAITVACAALVALLAVVLIPTARQRARTVHADLDQARFAGTQIVRLQSVISAAGGAAQIRACGQPVTQVGLQSKVAWATGLNVGNVGFKPGRAIDSGKPIVLFKSHLDGWRVRPIHTAVSDAARCNRVRRDTAF